MCEITDALIDVHYGVENYREEINRMNRELNKNKDFIKHVFNKRFKVRGIHARVDDYSLKDNWINLLPAPPDSGVDRLTLTFKEFAQQVEFIEED